MRKLLPLLLLCFIAPTHAEIPEKAKFVAKCMLVTHDLEVCDRKARAK